MNTNDYFKIGKKYLKDAKESQRENIYAASKLMGDCMLTNGVVQLFGLEEGRAFSMELGYRAGGLMPFHQFSTKDLLLRGVISNDEWNDPKFNDSIDMAHKLWDLYNIYQEDMFCLISNVGDNALIVEIAKMAKEKGHKVMVVTTMASAKEAVSKHPSGKMLYEFGDVIIDNSAPNPDTVLEIGKGNIKINQVSTIIGNVIAQMLTAETYRYITGLGHECEVLLSANVKGADAHNRLMSDKYLDRWNS